MIEGWRTVCEVFVFTLTLCESCGDPSDNIVIKCDINNLFVF